MLSELGRRCLPELSPENKVESMGGRERERKGSPELREAWILRAVRNGCVRTTHTLKILSPEVLRLARKELFLFSLSLEGSLQFSKLFSGQRTPVVCL